MHGRKTRWDLWAGYLQRVETRRAQNIQMGVERL